LEKILIIRLSSIGDIVLTTPVVRCIKKRYPDCELHYLTKNSFASILRENPYLDKVIAINEKIGEVIAGLRMEKYDHIVDLHKNFRSLKVRLNLGVPSSSFPKLNFKKWVLVQFKINKMPDIHIVDRYFKAVDALGVENDFLGLDYFIPEKDKVDITVLPGKHQNGYIGLVIGGKHATKQMPAEKIITFCKLIDFPVVILGGPEDKAEAEKICSAVGDHVFNACGKFNLNQSASLVEQAKLIITNDTGLMHVAAAFEKKIISVWGNTVPELGMYPYLPQHPQNSAIFEVKGLSCRPCSKLGFEKCPKGHFDCMMKQDIKGIAEKAEEFLGIG
jgi:ADP-heptose:LPS heptosyltransferase